MNVDNILWGALFLVGAAAVFASACILLALLDWYKRRTGQR